jgi:hypothetical protein
MAQGTRVTTRRLGFGAAALAIVAAAACGSSGTKSSGTNSRSTTPASSNAAATTTTTVAPVDLTSLKWARDATGLPDAANLNGVTAWRDSFIAIGVDSGTSGVAIWQSADGHSWSKDKIDADVFKTKEFPTAIASDGRRAVIVGFANDGAQGQPRAWYSTNGTTWTRAADDAFGAGTVGTPIGLHFGPKGYVGLVVTNAGAMAAVSKDGASWTVHKPIAASDKTARVNDVIGTDDGYVAAGVTGTPGSASVWTASDADTWTAVTNVKFTDPTAHRFRGMNAVTNGGKGLVAGGSTNNGSVEVATLWEGTGTSDWGFANDDGSFLGAQGSGVDMFATGSSNQLLAVGHASSASGGYAFGAWSSPDGITFTKVAASGSLAVSNIPKVTGVAVTSKAAVAVARLQEFDASQNTFVTRDLALFVGTPS